MSWIEIDFEDGRTRYRPGDEVRGWVLWDLEAGTSSDAASPPPERAEVRLVWLTRGRGDRDADVVRTVELPDPASADRRELRLRLPEEGPYSFSGALISLAWAVEVVLEPGGRAVREEIVVSPTGREVLLSPDPEGSEADETPGDGAPW